MGLQQGHFEEAGDFHLIMSLHELGDSRMVDLPLSPR